MITEPRLTIERKGIDTFEVRNLLHIIMLAEPGWVIPAGRYERRYAAFAVSTVKRGDRPYFRALHDQIKNGGAEAMFWDLRERDLEDWHPREIPEALLTKSGFAKTAKLQPASIGAMVCGGAAQWQTARRIGTCKPLRWPAFVFRQY
jgi:hypothetical protein